MKSKWILTGIAVIAVLLALAAGLTLAQGPEPPGQNEEGVQPQDIGIAAVLNVIPIQGRLTDASGNPVPDGNYSITASIYGVSTGGTALCTDTDNVAVSKGLFIMNIHNCTSDDINGRPLYLGIKVGTDSEMTPRQPIYPVPYAFSLRPGAIISDSASIDTLILINHGPNSYNQALYAYSENSNAVLAWTESPFAAVSGENHGTSGDRIGVYGYTSSTSGYGVTGFQTGYSTADNTAWKSGGLFGGRNGVIGISKESGGYAIFGWNRATTGGFSIGVYGQTSSTDGWAGYFTSAGNGVYISAASGKAGLNVVSGSKTAVVRAEDGARLLYTEESTEIWFTDYGFGKLQNGVAVITIDPLFAQTVNLKEPYHVFVQPYGDASLYVTNRTPTGFEVRLHDGDPNVEFSYRIVAKRLGYENARLERAPWADNDPNLYPEKRATLGVQQGGGQ